MNFKIIIVFAILLASCASTAKVATNANAEFMVYGNCGMCEKTIENSLKDKEGIGAADWNQSTKMIKVSYDSTLITINKIKELIASVGYDTDSHKADDEVYNKLHGCCKYERPKK